MWSQRTLLGLVVGLAAAAGAAAQTQGALRWRAGSTPLGLQPAASELRLQCGTMSLSCASPVTVPLYASPVAPRTLSMEVAGDPVPMAKFSRSPGLSVNLVGRAGIASDLGIYGRVGTTLPRSPGLAATGGDAGLNYGVGLTWDFSRRASAVLGWDSYDVRGATGELRDVRATSLGLHWRY